MTTTEPFGLRGVLEGGVLGTKHCRRHWLPRAVVTVKSHPLAFGISKELTRKFSNYSRSVCHIIFPIKTLSLSLFFLFNSINSSGRLVVFFGSLLCALEQCFILMRLSLGAKPRSCSQPGVGLSATLTHEWKNFLSLIRFIKDTI